MSVCTDNLAAAKTALHALMLGDQIVKTTVNGRSTEYAQADIADLKKYISDLEAECGELDVNGLPVRRRAPIKFYR